MTARTPPPLSADDRDASLATTGNDVARRLRDFGATGVRVDVLHGEASVYVRIPLGGGSFRHDSLSDPQFAEMFAHEIATKIGLLPR